MVEALKKRRPLSEETKRKIGLANTGHFHTDEFKIRSSLERGGVRIKTLPLFLRGAMVYEVVQITMLETKQVEGSRNDLRKSGELPKPTKLDESLAKRKAYLGGPRKAGREYTQGQRNSFAFVRKFCEAGLIGKDLSFWDELNNVFVKEGKLLPEAFSDKLRLEIFLKAVLEAKNWDHSLLRKYNEWGREIDEDWFLRNLIAEQELIIDVLFPAATIIKFYKADLLEDIYKKEERKLPSRLVDLQFLMDFYAARICLRENNYINTKDDVPRITMNELEKVWEEKDPAIFDRLKDEISFIVSKTAEVKPRLKNKADDIGARLKRAERFYRRGEVPESNH